MSLLEVLVVLSIAALILGVAAPTLRSPPRHLAEQEALASLERRALATRLNAIRSGSAKAWSPDSPLCATQSATPILYLPDGSAFGSPFCIRMDDQNLWIAATPLTGRLTFVDPVSQ
ncbi:pilus assembly FimT family protein [Tateyamaria omphalii]|uniref:pilus assembly FimT family protein n=1 Tax=Tateyamaria omphalii TaxID=299262 RepID=UPI001679D191|nr:type II secretion system protein [Tateyamaria omphalii]